MRYLFFPRRFPALAALMAGMLLVALGAAGLTGCANGRNTTATPPLAVTPTPGPDQTSTFELLQLAIPDPRSVAYAPAGDVLAIGSGATVWLYTRDLAPVRALEGHAGAVRGLAWSADGTRLASAALDNTVRVWDAASGALLTTLTGHTDWIFSVAWSPDGARLATASADGTARLWEAASGAPVMTLGTTRVERLTIRFQDDAVFQAISDLAYAERILKTVDGEPLSDLVARLRDTPHTLTLTLADQALADTLLALARQPYQVSVVVDDPALRARLGALDNAATLALLDRLADPAIQALLDQHDAAEQAVAAIYARPDADMIQTIRSLRHEEPVIIIQRADGETSTVHPGEEDFIATIAGLEGQDFTLSIGIENQAEIVARLEDPDFVMAVQQLDEALGTLSAISARDDAELVLLAGELRNTTYTIAITTGDPALDAALANLDAAQMAHLLDRLQDAAFLDALGRLDAAGYALNAVRDRRASDVLAALDDEPFTLALTAEDAALAGTLAALDQADLLRLVRLLDDPIFLTQLDQRQDAQDTIAQINARDDAGLIALVRMLAKPNTIEISFSLPEGGTSVKVARKFKPEDFAMTVTVQDEATIQALSALDDAAIAAELRALGGVAFVEQRAAGIYTVTPALDDVALGQFVDRLDSPMFQIEVGREANAHTDSVTAVAWSPDGTALVTGSADGTLKLWDPASGRLISTLEGHEDSVIAVDWSPDGTRIASGGWDNTGRVWDLSSGAQDAVEAAALKGHAERVIAVAWSPDSRILATGSRDSTIRLWDAASGDALAALEGHGAEVRALAWSPDGARLASVSLDGTLRLWDAAKAPGQR